MKKGDDDEQQQEEGGATTTTTPNNHNDDADPHALGGMMVVDITDIVVDCATNQLSITTPFLFGDNEQFNLHDAMAASQLMDPKMDCCQVPAVVAAKSDGDNDDSKQRMVFPRPIPQGLNDPMSCLPWQNLSIQDAMYVTMEILVRLQSFLSGSSVGESTFTCLYAHNAVLADMRNYLITEEKEEDDSSREKDATSLEDDLRRLHVSEEKKKNDNDNCTTLLAQWSVFAATLGLVEITEGVRHVILNADIYEEEDFAANTHNMVFFTTNHTKPVVPITIMNNNNNQNRSPTTTSDSNNDGGGDLLDTMVVLQDVIQKLQEEKCPGYDCTEPIQLVLKFQLHFLDAWTSLAHLSRRGLRDLVYACQGMVRQAVQALTELSQHVPTIMTAEDEGYPQPILQQTFDSFVNRPLVGNVPIRKISFQEPDKAISTLMQIASELDDCVCNVVLHADSLSRVQRMLDRVPDANILSRSLLLLNLYFDDKLLGQYNLQTLMKDHMLQLQTPPGGGSPPFPDEALVFMNRVAKPLYDTLKLRLLNRNRQRAYLEGVLLPDWAVLQNEAQILDYHLSDAQQQQQQQQQPPITFFTRYILTILIRLMDRYIEAGVAVGLVQNNHHDLTFHLWYRDFLLSALNQNLGLMRQSKETEALRISNETASATNAAPAKSHKGSKKKNHKHKMNGKHHHQARNNKVAEPANSPYEVEDMFELTIIALKRNLCRKSIQFLAALSQAGILSEKRFEFTSLERIFEKRFDVFGGIRQPPPLSYAHYVEGNDFSRIASEDLIQSVSDGFQYCRSSIDQLLTELSKLEHPRYAALLEPDLRALLKICIGNSVYVQKLRQLVQSGDDMTKAKVVFDFGTHPEFCIIKLS